MTPIAAIHVAKKQLGLDDDTYRAVLTRATGKTSSKDMSPAEQQAALAEFRRLGFQALPGGRKGASNGVRKGLQGRFAKKLQALWIAGYNLGIVRDRDDAALLAFAKRQTRIDHVRFLHDPEDAKKAVEALKAWLTRDGGVDWNPRKTLPPHMNAEGFRIAWAQYRLIVPGATYMGNLDGFWRMVRDLPAVEGDAHPSEFTREQWQDVMNAFGKRVREAAK